MSTFSSLKKNEWQNYAKTFKGFRPPWKPSSERITIYRKLIKRYVKGNKVLVLGATPEVRDMLARLKFNATLIDISPMMVKAMTSLRRTKSNEKIIIHNWLTAQFKDKFDLILGDSVVNNLHPKQLNTFFKQLTKWMAPQGVLILQNSVLLTPLSSIKISLEQIVKKIKNQPKGYKNYLDKAHDYLAYWYSTAKNHLNDLGKLEILLAQLYQKGILTKKEFFMMKMGFNSPTIISFYQDKEFRKILSRHFIVREVSEESQRRTYKDFYRFYVLNNK